MRDRRVVAAARSAAALAILGLSTAALGAGYASGVTEAGGNVTFILNANGQNVTVVRDGVPTSLGVLGLGSHSFLRSGATNYSIVVTSNAGDGYLGVIGEAIGIAGFRDGTLLGAPLQISDDNNVRNSFNAGRGLAVNLNPASGTLFGRVYIGNATAGSTAGFPTPFRTLEAGLYVNDAAGGDPTGQGDTARTGGINWTNGAASSPWRVAVDDEGFVYASDWSDNFGTLYRLDPNLSTGTNMFVGLGSGVPIAPSGTLNHGSVAAVHATGGAGAGNLVVYTLDEDLSPTGTASKLNSLWRYNAGSSTGGFDGIPDLLASSILIDNFAPGGIVVDMTRGKDGKFYLTQNRTDGNEVGLAVVAADGVTKVYDSLEDSRYLNLDGNAGVAGVQDVFRLVRSVEVSPDGRYMATIRSIGDIFITPLIEGIPDLPNTLLVDTFDNITLGRDVAFDLANNVYVSSSGNQALRVFSPGGPTETTYNSDGTFRTRTEPDFNGSGNYSNAANWLLGFVPNGADAYATVGNLSSGAQTLTIDTPLQLSRLRLSGGNYTVSGGSITMGAGFAEPRVIAEAGNHTVNSALNVQKNFGVAAYTGASLTLTNVSYASTSLNLTKFGGGLVTMPASTFNNVDVRFGTLKITANTPFDGTGTPVLETKTLRVQTGATLDVNNGGVIVDYDVDSPLGSIALALASGYAGGAWTGTGIASSAAAANSSAASVGYAEASTLGLTNFLGRPVDSTAVLVRYTRIGDANLDGITNIGDFSLLGANFNQPGDWSKGDFNYDGQVNIGDFSLLAANFNQTAPGDSARPGAVPEPASLGLLGLAGLGLIRRRRA